MPVSVLLIWWQTAPPCGHTVEATKKKKLFLDFLALAQIYQYRPVFTPNSLFFTIGPKNIIQSSGTYVLVTG